MSDRDLIIEELRKCGIAEEDIEAMATVTAELVAALESPEIAWTPDVHDTSTDTATITDAADNLNHKLEG